MLVTVIVEFAFILLEQKADLSLMKKYVKLKIFVKVEYIKKDNILKFNQFLNPDKMPYIIFA